MQPTQQRTPENFPAKTAKRALGFGSALKKSKVRCDEDPHFSPRNKKTKTQNARTRLLAELGKYATADLKIDNWATDKPLGATTEGKALLVAQGNALHMAWQNRVLVPTDELRQTQLVTSLVSDFVINKTFPKGAMDIVRRSPEGFTFGDLMQRIRNGMAYVPATMSGDKRGSNFVETTQFGVLDIDGQDVWDAKGKKIAGQQAYLAEAAVAEFGERYGLVWHRTHSFNAETGQLKYRMFVPFQRPLKNPAHFRAIMAMMNAALYRETGFSADPCSERPAQLFFGATGTEIVWPTQCALYGDAKSAARWRMDAAFRLAQIKKAEAAKNASMGGEWDNDQPVLLDKLRQNWNNYCDARKWYSRQGNTGQYVELWALIAGMSTKIQYDDLYTMLSERFSSDSSQNWNLEKTLNDLYDRNDNRTQVVTMGTVIHKMRETLGDDFVWPYKIQPHLPKIKSAQQPTVFQSGEMLSAIKGTNKRVTVVGSYLGGGKTYEIAKYTDADFGVQVLYKIVQSLDSDAARAYREQDINFPLRGRMGVRVYDALGKRWRDADDADHDFVNTHMGDERYVRWANTPTAGIMRRGHELGYDAEVIHAIAATVTGNNRVSEYDDMVKRSNKAKVITCNAASFAAHAARTKAFSYAVVVDEATALPTTVVRRFDISQIQALVKEMRFNSLHRSANLLCLLEELIRYVQATPNVWSVEKSDIRTAMQMQCLELHEIQSEWYASEYNPGSMALQEMREVIKYDDDRNPRRHLNPGKEPVFNRMVADMMGPILDGLSEDYHSVLSLTDSGIEITHENTAVIEALENAANVVVCDATATPERVAAMLRMPVEDIGYVMLQKPKHDNERLIQVRIANTNLAGRKDDTWDAISAVASDLGIEAVIDRIGAMARTQEVLPDVRVYGYGRDSRGSNALANTQRMMIVSTLVPNHTAVRNVLRVELLREPTDAEFQQRLDYMTRAELDQAVGRNRAVRDPHNEYTVVLINNRAVEGFEQVDCTEAAEEEVKGSNIRAIIGAMHHLIENSEKITQAAIADIIGVNQSTVSRHIKEYWPELDLKDLAKAFVEYAATMRLGTADDLSPHQQKVAQDLLDTCAEEFADEDDISPIDTLIWLHCNAEPVARTFALQAIPDTLKQQLLEIIIT
jgi:predicted transcriptional regulator